MRWLLPCTRWLVLLLLDACVAVYALSGVARLFLSVHMTDTEVFTYWEYQEHFLLFCKNSGRATCCWSCRWMIFHSPHVASQSLHPVSFPTSKHMSHTVVSMQAFAVEFLQCCHLECLMMGNTTAEEASSLGRHLRQVISASPQPPSEAANGCAAAGSAAGNDGAATHGFELARLLAAQDRPREVCVKLPAGVQMRHTCLARNPDEENCCVEVYYQVTAVCCNSFNLHSSSCLKLAFRNSPFWVCC